MIVVGIAIILNMKLHVPKIFMSFQKKGQSSLKFSNMSQKRYYWISSSHINVNESFSLVPSAIYIYILPPQEKYSLISVLALFALFSILSWVRHHQVDITYHCICLTSRQPNFTRHSGLNEPVYFSQCFSTVWNCHKIKVMFAHFPGVPSPLLQQGRATRGTAGVLSRGQSL